MAKFTLITLVVVIASMVLLSEACPPPCGCGCGGGGFPGFGRKKREVIAPQIKTQESDPCPQKEWKKIMEQNMGEDATSSSYAVQGALYKHYDTKFFVTCSNKSNIDKAVFVSNGEGYCNLSKGDILCQALALFG